MLKLGLTLLFTIITIIVLLGYTDPNNVNLAVYLAVFSLFYIFCFISIYIIIKTAYSKLPRPRQLFIAVVMSFSPVSLLAIGSLSSIKLLDVVLCIGVPATIVWYGLRQQTNK